MTPTAGIDRGRLRSSAAPVLAAAILVLFAGCIVTLSRIFSQTVDEPVHIAAGMQWLDRGAYNYSRLNPPLPRVAAAFLPFLAGQRSRGLPDAVAEGNSLLYQSGRYSFNLSRFRLGNLPFFLLSAAVVFVWTRRIAGDPPAVSAVASFAALPPVLGNAALATTDVAVMATLALAIFLFAEWLRKPSIGLAAGLGGAVGLAVLSKFSAILFFPAAAAAVLGARLLLGEPQDNPPEGRRLRSASLAVLLMLVTVWAGYRFSSGPLVRGGPRLPAPDLVTGLHDLAGAAKADRPSFLLGRQSLDGWWYYFPIALAVKTPIPFLVMASLGGFAAVAAARRTRDWPWLAAPAGATAVLLSILPTRIDVGIRYLLPIYPLLAVTAGTGFSALWASRGLGTAGRVAAAALLAWQLWISVAAYPDFLAYFNGLAGRHPERVLLDSNLDWGQDLLRLSEELRRRRVPSVAVCYFGSADILRHGLPNPRRLPPNERTVGWIAVSEMCLLDPAYAWLKAYPPAGRAGRSIRIYFIPGE
jgi:4-amino-4-deoxy-L-arabinose transferase-like glycosyltransferase